MKKLISVVTVGLMLTTTSCNVLKNVDTAGLMSAAAKTGQALTLTNDQVAQMVVASVQQMDAQHKIAPANSEYTQRLNRLVKGIEHVNNTPLNFKVYMTNEVNAFACADGSIRVYSGIMDMMNDDELVGIIGHEIGHVGMEHSTNAYKQALINSAIFDAVGSTSATMAKLTNSQLAQLASTFLSAKYSRSQENEADDFGYEFLKLTGRNPYNMVKAFEKMQKLESASGTQVSGNLANMFSSHPETSERIKRMTEKCRAEGYIQ